MFTKLPPPDNVYGPRNVSLVYRVAGQISLNLRSEFIETRNQRRFHSVIFGGTYGTQKTFSVRSKIVLYAATKYELSERRRSHHAPSLAPSLPPPDESTLLFSFCPAARPSVFIARGARSCLRKHRAYKLKYISFNNYPTADVRRSGRTDDANLRDVYEIVIFRGILLPGDDRHRFGIRNHVVGMR